MSSDQNNYSVPHLIGGASLPKDANPAIRGSVRREDPDANPAPHFTGLSGTTLNLDYSPTGAQAINFASDNMDAAIAAINAVDATNLEATDDNGYIRIRNLNGGSKNYLKIISGDAAPLLGFRVDPLPGSASYAGEIATSPAGGQAGQNNPHGTALVASDEDLSSSSINRAVIGSLLHVERIAGDLDLETLVAQEVAVTVVTHPISGEKVFRLQDPTLRIPIRGFGISVSNPAAGLLDPQLMIMENDGSGQSREFLDLSDATTFGRIVGVFYDDLTSTLDDSTTFAAWGTPDGKSIFNKSASADKHAAAAITSIDSDILTVTGATFVTLNCSPGDTALIAGATNNTPFNHDGEFIITEVITEEILRVRPKSAFDRTFSVTDTPRGLNKELPGGTSYGNISVLIGDFISANDLVFKVLPTSLVNGPHFVRMLVGRRIQETRLPLTGAHKPSLAKSDRRIAELLRIHSITAASYRHTASHIDASPIAGSPDALVGSTVSAQLAELLAHINSLIAGNVLYGGGVPWADGTTNPSTDLESQVDKILNDLVGASGSAKIASGAGPAWADATANPAERLDERLNSIINDLATGDGATKIAAAAVGDLLVGTLRAQLNQLDTQWLKLARANTVSATQTFTATQVLNPPTDVAPALQSTTVPAASSYRLLWEAATGGVAKARIYVGEGGSLAMTINAEWADHGSGLRWQIDEAPDDVGTIFRLTKGVVDVSYVDTAVGGPFPNGWPESSWRHLIEIDLADIGGLGSFRAGKDLVPGSNVGVVPSLGNLAAFSDIWTKIIGQRLLLGTYAEDAAGKALSIRGEKGGVNGWPGEYISKYMGLWSRKGFRIEEDFYQLTQFSHLDWIAGQTGGTTTFSYPDGFHSYRMGHTADPGSSGVNSLTLDPGGVTTSPGIRFTLVNGVIVRCRANLRRIPSGGGKVEFGFYDATNLNTNALTFVVQQDNGVNGMEFHVGSGRTVVDVGNDFPAPTGFRWYTFCLVGTTLTWVIDTIHPDPDTLVGGSVDSQSGAATIVVPGGQSQFSFQSHGFANGLTPGDESEMEIDYIEIIAGFRQ